MEIDWFIMLLGAASIGFGFYTAILRKTSPNKLGKLEAMKKYWGEKQGELIHVIGYSVIPIIIGLVIIANGLFKD